MQQHGQTVIFPDLRITARVRNKGVRRFKNPDSYIVPADIVPQGIEESGGKFRAQHVHLFA